MKLGRCSAQCTGAFLIWFTLSGMFTVKGVLRADEEQNLEETTRACGPTSLAIAATLVNRNPTDGALRAAFDGDTVGLHSLDEIAVAARRLGCGVKPVPLRSDLIGSVNLPMIVAARQPQSDGFHFLVVCGRSENRIQVIDYPHPPRFIDFQELIDVAYGVGLYVGENQKTLDDALDKKARTLTKIAIALSFAASALLIFPRFVWLAGRRQGVRNV